MQPTVSDVLSKLERLEYVATSPDDGSYRIVVDNDPSGGRGVISVYNVSTGDLVFKLYYTFSDQGLVNATLYEASTGKNRSLTVVQILESFQSSVEIVQDPNTGAPESIRPAPGIGPVYLIWFLSDKLLFSIDDLSSRGSVTSVLSRVSTGFVKANWSGERYGVVVIAEPNQASGIPGTLWSYARVTATLISYQNWPLAAEYVVRVPGAGGEDYVSIRVESVTLRG